MQLTASWTKSFGFGGVFRVLALHGWEQSLMSGRPSTLSTSLLKGAPLGIQGIRDLLIFLLAENRLFWYRKASLMRAAVE